MRVVPLSDLTGPQQIQVIDLMIETWPDHYGPDDDGIAEEDFYGRVNPQALPIGFALLDGARAIGTAALSGHSYGQLGSEGPWLTGLAVHPDFRGRGGASLMVQHLMDKQTDHLWATTQSATGLLERLDWKIIRQQTDEQGKTWNIMTHQSKTPR